MPSPCSWPQAHASPCPGPAPPWCEGYPGADRPWLMQCRLCGEFGEDHGGSTGAPGPTVPAALISPAISRTPPAGADFRLPGRSGASLSRCLASVILLALSG